MTENHKKPVVMQILPALENGGVERGTIDIAKALKKEGFEPIVVSSGGVLVYQLKEAKISISSFQPIVKILLRFTQISQKSRN